MLSLVNNVSSRDRVVNLTIKLFGEILKSTLSLGGLKPPVFQLTSKCANQLRHEN